MHLQNNELNQMNQLCCIQSFIFVSFIVSLFIYIFAALHDWMYPKAVSSMYNHNYRLYYAFNYLNPQDTQTNIKCTEFQSFSLSVNMMLNQSPPSFISQQLFLPIILLLMRAIIYQLILQFQTMNIIPRLLTFSLHFDLLPSFQVFFGTISNKRDTFLILDFDNDYFCLYCAG
jgi:hypothetical protein